MTKSFLISLASIWMFFAILTIIMGEVNWANAYDGTKLALILSVVRTAFEYIYDTLYNK